ncbi:MAG TPA: YqgE/AlgH family protein [Burkholderiales bacterium]|nr:YqgE/AlgH family protein [Burkholderiales bacterium]
MNLRTVVILVMLAACPALGAQPSGIVLVAKPGLPDPNFSETVVLVTHTDEGNPVGVILNRPTTLKLAEAAPRVRGAKNFTGPLYSGGPVMREVLIALFRSATPPAEAAFQVLPGVYLTMHPATIEALIAEQRAPLRLFAGFAGWAPRQLESEIDSGSWYVLRATEALAFRGDTAGMWAELVAQASGARTAREAPARVAAR